MTDYNRFIYLCFCIGYWNLVAPSYASFAPSNISTSLHYLDWVCICMLLLYLCVIIVYIYVVVIYIYTPIVLAVTCLMCSTRLRFAFYYLFVYIYCS